MTTLERATKEIKSLKLLNAQLAEQLAMLAAGYDKAETYTPGPWSVSINDDETTIESDLQTIATQVSNCDAPIIAAAPVMLYALRIAERRFAAIGYDTSANLCRAAIAKASI